MRSFAIEQRGYAMAALLVSVSVMGVLIAMAMPVWRQNAKREREAELVFRGQQYVRAIRLFQQRAGPGVMPPSIDVLVEQRFLRKEFKDPMTGEKFLVLPGVVPTSGVQTQIQSAQTAIGRAREETQARLNAAAGRGRGSTPSPTGAVEQPAFGTVQGGIAGVVSKSQDESLLIYNGRTRYNEWEFRYTPVAAAPGQGGDAAGAAGARGGVGAGARGQDPGRGARRGGPGSSTIDNTGGRGMQQGGRGFRLQPDGRGGVQMTPLDPTGNPGATPPPAGQTPRGGAAAPQAPGGVYRR